MPSDHVGLYYKLKISDPDCQEAAQALRQADDRIAGLEARVAEQLSTIKDNIRTISQLAREAGEAKGKLEMSEAAGIVEGWREKAEAAEAKVKVLGDAIDAAFAVEGWRKRPNAAETKVAAEARVQALEIAAVKAAEPLEALRLLGPKGVSDELWGGIVEGCDAVRAALAQSGG